MVNERKAIAGGLVTLALLGGLAGCQSTYEADARATAAAQNAERSAARAEAAVSKAESALQRAEAVVAKMESEQPARPAARHRKK
jgi:Tfp pilus assembly protein PilX